MDLWTGRFRKLRPASGGEFKRASCPTLKLAQAAGKVERSPTGPGTFVLSTKSDHEARINDVGPRREIPEGSMVVGEFHFFGVLLRLLSIAGLVIGGWALGGPPGKPRR